MQSYDLAFHDYAQLFPLIIGDDYEALLEDIDTNGQRAPIVHLLACRLLAKDFSSGLVLPMQVETVLAEVDADQRCSAHDDGLRK